MKSPAQPHKQEEQLPAQHTTHKQQLQHQPEHRNTQKQQLPAQSAIENPQNKVQQEAFTSAEAPQRRGSEKQRRREERPQQRQTQQSRQAPRFRSHSNSSSQSRQRRWRGSVSPQPRTAPPDTTINTNSQQEKPTSEETHSKRRRNRRNRRQRDKAEQSQQDKTSDNVSGRVNHTRQSTEPGQGKQFETVTIRGRWKVSDNPDGAAPARVTRRAEWTSSASASEGGIRKKCKSAESTGVLRNNARPHANTNASSSEECETRLYSGGGSNSLTTSPTRQDHHAMPVTMPPETSNNRRRAGKAAAQIYRPPPARSSHEEVSPAHHPHSPAQSRTSPQEPLGYHTYPVVSRQRTDSECSTATNASDFYGKNRGKRPDQVLYVPRGRRHIPSNTTGSARATPTPLQDLEPLARPPSPTYSICSVASEYSGRNRYGRQGSQASLFDGEIEGRVRNKPPQVKCELNGRETSGGNHRPQKGGAVAGRFSNETYQLIERCLNQDAECARNRDRPVPSEYHKGQSGRKSPAPPRDAQHSIHSKENIMAPQAESGRRAKKRRSRRRHSRSREPSAEHHNRVGMGEQPPRPPTPSYGNPGGERGAGSCERVFYNSSYERQDRGYDNYDRYSSSRASSRNTSLERSTHNPNLSWRAGGMGGSNPMSPSKGSPQHCPPRFRGSSGKPPSGRLGSLPNVALDLGESSGPSRDPMEHCHTLPVHLPSTHREEAAPCTNPANSTPSRSKQDTPRLSLDNSMTSSWGDGMVLLDNSDAESPSQSQNMKTPSKESLDSTARSPALSSEPSPCSSPAHPVEEDSIQDTANHNTLNQTTIDHSETRLDHRDTSQANTDNISVPDPLPTDSWDQNQAELPENPTEAVQPATTEEHNIGTEDREEKKASKKFAFNWADEVEDSWDSLYDDSGDCLDPDLKQQLNDTLGKVKLEKPVNDYCRFQPRSDAEMNEDDYAHVIEIYDFPTSFKTQDLTMVFGQFLNAGFDIKWVDDTHALGIFSTSLMAAEALSLRHPFLKTRSLSNATKSSRAKAMRITDALLPYKPRPATSAALARRLVSGALGLKVNISREVREAERQKLKDAKARKRLEAKQRLDAWEGNLT